MVHGQDAVDSNARRVVMFFYEVLFRPNLTGTLNHKSGIPIAVANDGRALRRHSHSVNTTT